MDRVFIINETSGSGKSLKIARRIREIDEQEKLDSIMISTMAPRDAVLLSRSLARCDRVIYSVGGDGTLNEVVEGIVNSDTSLGIIPAGTGNDFARMIDNHTHKIDVISVNDRYAINILSFGIDAEVANQANILKKEGKVRGVYWRGILKTVPSFQSPTLTLDDVEKSITLLTVCNGSHYGNGFPMNRGANISDGILELYVVDPVSKLQIPGLFYHLQKGTHLECEQVNRFSIKNLEIRCTHELIGNLDGEIMKDSHYKIALLPQRIQYYQEENPKLKKLIEDCRR